MTQVRTTCVPELGHRSALSLCDLRPSGHTTTGGHVTSFVYKEGGMSGDGDAASGCAMFWKSVSVFDSESVPQ